MNNNFLIVENISKYYQQNKIFENIYFCLNQGENIVIQGKSGCGKTTLLRCIGRLEKIDKGRIIFNNEVVSKPKYIKPVSSTKNLEIAMVFQHLYLWQHMTVLDNVMLPLWLRNGRNKKEAQNFSIQKLAELGIENKAYDYPNQLSGGQQQRVALARALVHSPNLLLLDEITANLDPETAQIVMNLIEKIALQGTSIIMITHSNLNSSIWSFLLQFDGVQWQTLKF